MKVSDSVVLVTGASRGIGRAVAEAAARRGARVGLLARDEADLRETLEAIGGRGCVAPADVGDREAVVAAVARVADELGPVDVVVANAGIGQYGRFVDADPETLEQLVRVNVMGTFHTVGAVLPGMVERGRGHVVIVGSIAGRIGAPFEAAYSATKFAQTGFAEALGIELTGTGVGVSLISPGVIATDFFRARGHEYDRAFPRPIPPEKVAAAVVDAVEKEQAQRTVPRWLGPTVVMRHLAPALYRAGTRRTFADELAGNNEG